VLIKALKIKELMRVVGFVIAHFLELGKKLQSHSKDYSKASNRWKSSTWWNFLEFWSLLQNPPKNPPHPLARFLHVTRPFFSIHFLSLQKLQKQKQKINQIVERVRFEAFGVVFGVALEWLWSFLTIVKNCTIIKPYQAPPPRPLSMLKSVENQAPAWC